MERNYNLEVIKTGFLKKRSKIFKFWNSRFCILTETYFFTYQGIEKNSECTNSIALSAIINVKNTENDYINSFSIQTNNSILYFIAENNEIRNDWVNIINKTIINLCK